MVPSKSSAVLPLLPCCHGLYVKLLLVHEISSAHRAVVNRYDVLVVIVIGIAKVSHAQGCPITDEPYFDSAVWNRSVIERYVFVCRSTVLTNRALFSFVIVEVTISRISITGACINFFCSDATSFPILNSIATAFHSDTSLSLLADGTLKPMYGLYSGSL